MNVTKLYEDSDYSARNHDLHAVISEKEQYHVDEAGEKYITVEPNKSRKVSSGIKIDERVRHKVVSLKDSGFSTKELKDVPYTEELWCLVTNDSDEEIKIFSGDKIGKLETSAKKQEVSDSSTSVENDGEKDTKKEKMVKKELHKEKEEKE